MNIQKNIIRYREINARIAEMAEILKKENRERNEAEEAEYASLKREKQQIEMEYDGMNSPKFADNSVKSIDAKFREVLKELNGSKNAITLQVRETLSSAQTTTALDGTGIIPVKEQEMLNPLRAGLIWDKVGITLKAGKHLRWPKHGKATAAWAGEAEKLTPGSIDWSKVESVSKRLGIAIDVTRQELEESEGVVEGVIRSEMPAAIIDKVNEALFTTTTTNFPIYGPFAKAGLTGGCEKVTFASTTTPTRAEILSMKAKIAKAGINTSTCCWVMTENMKALLEDVKVDTGSGRFLVENDRMLGFPIYTTDAIGDKNIGFGDWGYQACGFGEQNIIFDPYTLALYDSSRFVDNSDVTFATLRTEAFVLGVCKATAG